MVDQNSTPDDMQLANANQKAHEQIKASNSGIKIAFLVEVEHPTNPKINKQYLAIKTTEYTYFLDIVGCEISNTQDSKNKKIDNKTLNETLENAEKEDNIVNIRFPWQRVKQIINVNYQHKKGKK